MAGKRLWGVTALADDDTAMVEPLVGTLRLCAEYLAMDWRGVLLGNGSRPGDVLTDQEALNAAKYRFDLEADRPDTPAIVF